MRDQGQGHCHRCLEHSRASRFRVRVRVRVRVRFGVRLRVRCKIRGKVAFVDVLLMTERCVLSTSTWASLLHRDLCRGSGVMRIRFDKAAIGLGGFVRTLQLGLIGLVTRL